MPYTLTHKVNFTRTNGNIHPAQSDPNMLTPKQQELLLYINSRLARDGISPSFEEMKNAVGIRSSPGSTA